MREGTQMKHKLNRRLAKLACAKTKRPKSLTTMRCADLKNSFKKLEKKQTNNLSSKEGCFLTYLFLLGDLTVMFVDFSFGCSKAQTQNLLGATLNGTL